MTGTRGKSSVVRLLTAALREDGFTVLAKTTGSRPMHLLPDGNEEVIPRRGPASIVENKNLLKMGATLGVRALVAEMMSIHPENIFTESAYFIRPHVLVVTNVRPDHVAQMGSTHESVARSLSAAISHKATVVVPEKEYLPIFEETAKQHEARIVRVHENEKLDMSGLPYELEENVRLSLAVTDLLNIDRQTALRGIQKARPDLGATRVWRTKVGVDSLTWHMVSLFAANDPQFERVRRSTEYSNKGFFPPKTWPVSSPSGETVAIARFCGGMPWRTVSSPSFVTYFCVAIMLRR